MGVVGGSGGFDLFAQKIKAFTEVGTLAKIGAWADEYDVNLVRRRIAHWLSNERSLNTNFTPPQADSKTVSSFRVFRVK